MSEERGDAMKLVVTERGVEAARPLRGVDHVLVGVRNLEAARDTYRRLGFTVSPRSEEHTSELPSLMGTSYAVFCLEKKTRNQTIKIEHRRTEYSQNITTIIKQCRKRYMRNDNNRLQS